MSYVNKDLSFPAKKSLVLAALLQQVPSFRDNFFLNLPYIIIRRIFWHWSLLKKNSNYFMLHSVSFCITHFSYYFLWHVSSLTINIFHLHTLFVNFNILLSHSMFSQGNLDYKNLTIKKKILINSLRLVRKYILYQDKINSVSWINHCQWTAMKTIISYRPETWV